MAQGTVHFISCMACTLVEYMSCGIWENWKKRSVDREHFAKAMKDLHEKVKSKLQDNSQRYKQ